MCITSRQAFSISERSNTVDSYTGRVLVSNALCLASAICARGSRLAVTLIPLALQGYRRHRITSHTSRLLQSVRAVKRNKSRLRKSWLVAKQWPWNAPYDQIKNCECSRWRTFSYENLRVTKYCVLSGNACRRTTECRGILFRLYGGKPTVDWLFTGVGVST